RASQVQSVRALLEKIAEGFKARQFLSVMRRKGMVPDSQGIRFPNWSDFCPTATCTAGASPARPVLPPAGCGSDGGVVSILVRPSCRAEGCSMIGTQSKYCESSM